MNSLKAVLAASSRGSGFFSRLQNLAEEKRKPNRFFRTPAFLVYEPEAHQACPAPHAHNFDTVATHTTLFNQNASRPMRIAHAALFFIPARHRRRAATFLLVSWTLLIIGTLSFAAIERFGIVQASHSYRIARTLLLYAAVFALLTYAVLPLIQTLRSIERHRGKSWCVVCAHPLLTDTGIARCSECGCEQDAALSSDIYQLSNWAPETEQTQKQQLWTTKPAIRHTSLNAPPYQKLVQPPALSRPFAASLWAAVLWIPIGLVPSAHLWSKGLDSGLYWFGMTTAVLLLVLSIAAWKRQQRRRIAIMQNGFACVRCANPFTQTQSVEPCPKCKFNQHPARSKEIWQMAIPFRSNE